MVLFLNLLLHETSFLSLPVLCHAINFAARSDVNMPYSSTKSLVFLVCLPELYPVYHHVTVCFSNWPCTTPTEYGFCWNFIFFVSLTRLLQLLSYFNARLGFILPLFFPFSMIHLNAGRGREPP